MRRVKSSFKPNQPHPISIVHMEMASHFPSLLAHANLKLNSQKVTCRIFLSQLELIYLLNNSSEEILLSDELVFYKFLSHFSSLYSLILAFRQICMEILIFFWLSHEKFRPDVKIAFYNTQHKKN